MTCALTFGMMKSLLAAAVAALFASQHPQRLLRITFVFEPDVSMADSTMIVASFRDATTKALRPGPLLTAGGKITQKGGRATMIVGLVDAKTGAILARDSVMAKMPLLRDSARVLGARLAGRVH